MVLGELRTRENLGHRSHLFLSSSQVLLTCMVFCIWSKALFSSTILNEDHTVIKQKLSGVAGRWEFPLDF